MEEKNGKQGRVEARFEGGQGPEGAVAPYVDGWPARLYSIFPHYLIYSTFFKKRLMNTKCVF
jgi:hypothetical protein